MEVVSKPVQIGIRIHVNKRKRNPQAVFRCNCGKAFIAGVGAVRSGNTTSCGCYRSKLVTETNTTHGKSRSKIYAIWANMMGRCRDASNLDYGGRGISVAQEWHDFETFFAAVGDQPFSKAEIDRIDNSRGYMPGNVRWVTRSENVRNRRNTRWVCFQGETISLSEAASRIGWLYHKLKAALNANKQVDGITFDSGNRKR